jgi:hypothetical protein
MSPVRRGPETANPARTILALWLLVAGCVGRGPGAAGPAAGTGSAPASIPTPPCSDNLCVYHRGTETYHRCLAVGPGGCVHYGTACDPANRCFFSADKGRYLRCTAPADGGCERFAEPCLPGGDCLVDPRDGLHRKCERMQQGRCEQFADLCTPQ